MDSPDLGNALGAADGRHTALVPIAKGPAGFVLHTPANFFRNILPHLDGDRSHPRHRCAILLEVCQVAYGEDLWVSLDVQPVIDNDSAASIGFSQSLT